MNKQPYDISKSDRLQPNGIMHLLGFEKFHIENNGVQYHMYTKPGKTLVVATVDEAWIYIMEHLGYKHTHINDHGCHLFVAHREKLYFNHLCEVSGHYKLISKHPGFRLQSQ